MKPNLQDDAFQNHRLDPKNPRNYRGIVLIDDYQRETLPGVERAIRDFFRGRDLKHLQVQANIAIIKV
jgi:hypothetical protein